jgi:hypothetical protein
VKAERTADALEVCDVSSVTRLFNLVNPNLGNVDMLLETSLLRVTQQGKTINTLLVQN